MKYNGNCTRRAALYNTASWAGFLLIPSLGYAEEKAGVYVLDTQALRIDAPARVALVAVTRAGRRMIAVGEHGVIVYSDDSGGTWSQANVPVDVTLTCVQFASPNLGWAAGNFGVILNTQDAGKTWRLQLNGIQANQLTLTAAQEPALQSSGLPGAPFAMKRANAFIEGGPNKPFLCLLVISPQKVLVCGSFKLTMLTIDGGDSWQDWSLHILDRLSHNLYDAQIIDSKMFIVGEAGLVFCSTDGGGSFQQATSPADVTLFGLVGTKDNNVIVFGVAGSCYRSTSGGNSWVTINLPTSDNLTAGRLLDSGDILIASETGVIFRSKDNGETFAPLSGMPMVTIFDLEQAPNGDLILVGASGAISIPAALLST
jgi:photosystem II stability/assembly factor-like uncharacterized protein